MAKREANLPKAGDRVRLKGRAPRGQLASVTALKWCRVKWDDGYQGPMLVHLQELEKDGPQDSP